MPKVYIKSDSVDVTYPMRETTQRITKAEHAFILAVENKVQSIKFIRDQYGLGLYEAKMVVDTIKANDYFADFVPA